MTRLFDSQRGKKQTASLTSISESYENVDGESKKHIRELTTIVLSLIAEIENQDPENPFPKVFTDELSVAKEWLENGNPLDVAEYLLEVLKDPAKWFFSELGYNCEDANYNELLNVAESFLDEVRDTSELGVFEPNNNRKINLLAETDKLADAVNEHREVERKVEDVNECRRVLSQPE